MADQTRRDMYQRRKAALENERSSFVGHWRELSDFIRPRAGRFFLKNRNIGTKRYQSIINSKATQALKVSRAGMMSGIMSNARPWFSLQTENPDFMDNRDIRVWLDAVTLQMNNVFNKSNLFNMTPVMLDELLLFGTGAMSHVDDDVKIARFYSHPIGSYMIAQNDSYEVDTFVREFEMTTSQLIGFGKENCSAQVRNAYDRGDYDTWWTVVNFVEPNKEYDGVKQTSKYKKFRSCYYESDSSEKELFLRESGFDDFPVYVPRWDLTGEDIYGTDCPGMIALGDVRQLQTLEKRKAQAIDKLVSPPLKGPSSLRNIPISSLPGGVTIYDNDGTKEGLSPLYTVDPRLQEMLADIEAVERRIGEAFYTDLFFAITQMEGIQPRTQLELTQRNQERLLQLGPVLERLHNEFLAKLIERMFNQLARKAMLPPAPPGLEGQSLKVEFVSSLAMAQRSQEVGAIRDLGMYVDGLVKGGFPEAADNVDPDLAIGEMSLLTGVPSKIIRSAEAVADIRDKRLKQAQAQAQQQQAMQMADTAAQLKGKQ